MSGLTGSVFVERTHCTNMTISVFNVVTDLCAQQFSSDNVARSVTAMFGFLQGV